jgi:glycine cleavage system regulatory protein
VEVSLESLVLTVIGPDRPGLVESIASTIARNDGSWVESRMSRLGGQFAGILRATVPKERSAELFRALMQLERGGLRVVVQPEVKAPSSEPVSRRVYLELLGADRPGIVQSVTAALAQHNVNVEELETQCIDAPMSGELLFKAQASLSLPAGLDLASLRERLEAIAADLMVDLRIAEDANKP